MTIRLATGSRNAATTAVVGRLDTGGTGAIRIYTGAQPATGDTAVAGSLLVTIPLTSPAFGAAASGAAAAGDPAAVASTGTGTAGWFRAVDGAGNGVFDGSVTATGAGGDLQLSSTSLAPGVSVDITAFTYTTPAG